MFVIGSNHTNYELQTRCMLALDADHVFIILLGCLYFLFLLVAFQDVQSSNSSTSLSFDLVLVLYMEIDQLCICVFNIYIYVHFNTICLLGILNVSIPFVYLEFYNCSFYVRSWSYNAQYFIVGLWALFCSVPLIIISFIFDGCLSKSPKLILEHYTCAAWISHWTIKPLRYSDQGQKKKKKCSASNRHILWCSRPLNWYSTMNRASTINGV